VLQSSERHEFVTYRWQWRGAFENFEVTALHGDAFEAGVVVASETDWQSLLANHSLGWVTARDRDQLLGFVNVIWDGQLHAWIQDPMVNSVSRHLGVGTELVATAREAIPSGAVFANTARSDQFRPPSLLSGAGALPPCSTRGPRCDL